jgi:SMC interacting uncharacterized protein involved in chromosome segregation
METKLITKTIKELADEYDGNVEQLHREIGRCNAHILRLQEDNESLNYHVEFQKLAREKAEKLSETSILAMYFVIAIMFSISVHNYLFG